MAGGVQITIVMSPQGRCHFVESLKGIMLNTYIFIENERIRLCNCNIVEQQYLCVFPDFFLFVLVLHMS